MYTVYMIFTAILIVSFITGSIIVLIDHKLTNKKLIDEVKAPTTIIAVHKIKEALNKPLYYKTQTNNSSETAPATQPVRTTATVQAPATQPVRTTATVQAPAIQPVRTTATVQAPATQPVRTVSTVQAPATQPVNTTATVQAPATQPVSITPTVVAPAVAQVNNTNIVNQSTPPVNNNTGFPLPEGGVKINNIEINQANNQQSKIVVPNVENILNKNPLTKMGIDEEIL